MADVKLTNIVSGGNLKLAPDLTAPGSYVATTATTRNVSGINAVGALTTALSLTGKFSIAFLQFAGLTSETITIKLTVDGTVIWNDTFSCSTAATLIGSSATKMYADGPFTCDSSFLLEIQTATDTNVNLEYLARPIL